MNKKLLVLFLIAALTAFVFVSCVPTPPNEGEGEGEGELELSIVIEDAYEKDGTTYVKAGKSYNVVVTFPTKADNVMAYYKCIADLAKGPFDTDVDGAGLLAPNADGTVWSGAMSFTKPEGDVCGETDCSVGYVWVKWGLCDDCYYGMPVVIDGDLPYMMLKVSAKCCDCEGCKLTFESTTLEGATVCDNDEDCCGDNCSGLAGWSIDIYDKDPFGKCCSMDCAKPICPTLSGTDCPIKATLDCCLEADDYYVLVTVEDNVGNTVMFGGELTIDDSNCDDETEPTCTVTLSAYCKVCPGLYETNEDGLTFGACNPDSWVEIVSCPQDLSGEKLLA